MRKLIFATNISLDGCCDHTKLMGTEDVHNYHANLLRDADTLLYGRKTYQLMFPFWPDIAKNHSGPTKSMNDFAQVFSSVPKVVVFSKTLANVPEKNARIVQSGLNEEILKLKQEPGKNIATGGVDIPGQLMKLGLIDEYHVVVNPIIVGEGRRLTDGLRFTEDLKLKLIESKVLPSGFVALHYAKSR